MDWEQVARYYQKCAAWFAINNPGAEVPEWCSCNWPSDTRLIAISEEETGWWFPESAEVPYFVTARKNKAGGYRLISYIEYYPLNIEIKELHKTKDLAIKAAYDDTKRKLSFYKNRQRNIEAC